jgi:hypothetical protein
MRYKYEFQVYDSGDTAIVYSFTRHKPRTNEIVGGFACAFQIVFDTEPLLLLNNKVWELQELGEIVRFAREESKNRAVK